MSTKEELIKENEYLKSLLEKNNISYDTNTISKDDSSSPLHINSKKSPSSSEKKEDEEEPRTTHLCIDITPHNIPSTELPLKTTVDKIDKEFITEKHTLFLYSLFKGRKDVYSKRATLKNGKSAYFPVCNNFWKEGTCPKRIGQKIKCMDCSNREWTPLNQRAIMAHLLGYKDNCSDVIGIYPLLLDNTCNFLVFDFDNHNEEPLDSEKASYDLVTEVKAIREICKTLSIPCYVERSRSGKGCHIWFFFSENIPSSLARSFGSSLLTKGAEYVNQKSFVSYDRMLPSQDTLPKGGLGNLIALPLQGKALEKFNSAFRYENFVAYKNQW